MAQVLRVSLPTYNSLTDNDANHYALFADQDNILIKEHSRGSASISDGNNTEITHSLTYVPFVIVFFERTSGTWRKLLGDNEFSVDVHCKVSTTKLTIYNDSGSTKSFKYYIFYDQIV